MDFQYKFKLALRNGTKELFASQVLMCCPEMGEAWRVGKFTRSCPIMGDVALGGEVNIYYSMYKTPGKEIKNCPFCGADIVITQLSDGSW